MLYHISQQQSSDDHQYSHQDSSFYDPAVLFLRGSPSVSSVSPFCGSGFANLSNVFSGFSNSSQASSLLIITKNFSLFVTNFKKACRSLHTLFVHRLIYSKIISTFPSQSTSMPPRYITGKKIPGHPRRLLRFSVLLLWSAAENHQNIPFQRRLPDLPSASLHGSI